MAEESSQSLPAQVGQFARNKGLRQLALLTGIAGSVALGVVIVLWARGPQMNMLFGSLADRDAADVVQVLESSGIPYRMEASKGSVLVPSDRIHDARLQLAAQGLPRGTGLGFEMMEEETGFGVSQFMETARYQHMLETEIVRTITNLRPVQSARVHLALPKQSVFMRERRPASASVMVQLYAGRRLEESQVAAIVHLVASSIPDIEAGAVTVVDQQGRMLTRPEQTPDLLLTAQQFDHVQRVQESYSGRIESLLSPIVGHGRVRANVTVDMDFTHAEETRKRVNPDASAVLSEQTSREDRFGGEAAAGGVPGALSNQPPETGAAGSNAAAPPASTSSRRSMRNFEVDQTVSHVRQPTGRIQRMSVAVIVDDWLRTDDAGAVQSVPLSTEEVERLTALVRETVGFDASRGDSVNVINQSFQPLNAGIAPEALPMWQRPIMVELAKQVLGGLLLLGVLLVLVRPIVRNLLQAAPALPEGLPAGGALALEGRTIDQREDSDVGQIEDQGQGPSYEQKIAMARELVEQDPKRVAQVVKGWVATDG